MHVVVDLPDPKPNGLDAALAKQFGDIQRQLLHFMQSQQDTQEETRADLLKTLHQQQERLVDALESLMGMVQQSVEHSRPSDALLDAMQGLKHLVSELPRNLKDAIGHQFQDAQDRTVKVSVHPQVTVAMPKGVVDRIDSLETALLNGLRKSRNRTFGSNY